MNVTSSKESKTLNKLFTLVKYYVTSLELLVLGMTISIIHFIISAVNFVRIEQFYTYKINLIILLLGFSIYCIILLKLFIQIDLFQKTT